MRELWKLEVKFSDHLCFSECSFQLLASLTIGACCSFFIVDCSSEAFSAISSSGVAQFARVTIAAGHWVAGSWSMALFAGGLKSN